MELNMQHECMNEHCKTVTLTRDDADAVRCPECGGLVISKRCEVGIDMVSGLDMTGHIKR